MTVYPRLLKTLRWHDSEYGMRMAWSGTAQPTAIETLLITGFDWAGLPREDLGPGSVEVITRYFELVELVMDQHGALRSARNPDGRSVLAVFGSSTSAVAAALAVQRAMSVEYWPGGVAIRARIGLRTNEILGHVGVDRTEIAVNRCARLRDVAHGGQTLLSSSTASIVDGALPDGAWLVDLGMHRLRDLSRPEHVYELRHGDLAHDFAPLRSLDLLPNNLPTQLTTFVGRSDEVVEVRRLLAAQRLVTLAGSGGCGKTRLAVQVAAEIADRWPDGVWWVDLGSVTDATLVAEMTASTLRILVEPAGGPLRALTSQLRGQRLLLCLDTCEHLLDATAELAETLLRSCPGVSVLATSREPLGVTGETVWRVPSLPAPDAVRLFTDRARLVRPGFSVDSHDDAVSTICQRLDGIPLAVELAARWVRALTPTQIADGMDDRFRLLAGGPRRVVARHRTLAASIQWSHDLLDEQDQTVLRRLAVFAGGFTLGAARDVCTDSPPGDNIVLAALGRLVDKSLILAIDGPGEVRFRMLDTIRQYAEDRLYDADETDALRDRHLDHFLRFAAMAESELDEDQDLWRSRLKAEHDNLRAALEWGLASTNPNRGRRLASTLARFWFLHGYSQEAISFLTQAIERVPHDRSTLQASLLSGLALVALGAGRPALTADVAARGLQIALANDDDRNKAMCLVLSAYLPLLTDYSTCQKLAVQARSFAESAGDRFATDFAKLMEAACATAWDHHRQGVTLAQEFVQGCLARGERFCAAFGLSCDMWAAWFGGDLRAADALGTEVLRIAEPLGDYFTIGLTTLNLAWVKGLAGEVEAGHHLMEPIVRSIEHAGPDVELLPWLALGLGKMQLWSGDFAGAVARLEQATRFADPLTDNWITVRALPSLASALRRLNRTQDALNYINRGIALARKLHLPHALADALEEAAFLASANDPAAAEDLHHQALAIRVEHELRTFYVDSLDALAAHAVQAGGADRAARLIAASDTARDLMGYPRPIINKSAHTDTVSAIRTALSEAAFDKAWSQGATLSLDQAVAYATRARGARDRPSKGWASLTRTELEVINLVVDGLTNPQIGSRLFMSRATVKTHLSHVYTKLDIANRTELATLAATRLPSRDRGHG
ncbi:MAG TPA: LuxR family transcriptional regulator [Micromonosporaceae bacterium]|nr:LuxR family transcriptional regulator [Micromonosporaceae bacterium]HCU52701.1 LuxR family transcriptional regulator [Micromonosporaceae bacterium]